MTRVLAVAGALLRSVTVAACTNTPSTPAATTASTSAASSPSGAQAPGAAGVTTAPTPSVAGAAGAAIPARTIAPGAATSAAAGGPPVIVAFNAPTTFRCLADGKQGQVTLGWVAPDATAVDVQLDGARPAVGIQDALPYQVPAGRPVGVGSTVVFDCAVAAEHTITVRWSAGADTNVTERSVTVRKESP